MRGWSWLVATLTILPITAAADSKPSILLVTADDLGLQLGCHGDRIAHTPNVDRFAQSAVRFTNAYVTQSSCSSSRSSLLTGLYPHQNGQIGLAHLGYSMTSARIPTLPALLKQAGYRTGIIGKLHVMPEEAFPFDYKRVSAPESRNGELVEQRVREFVDGTPKGRPFFLYLNFFDPHGPYLRDVNGRPARKVGPADVPPWPFTKKGKPAPPPAVANFYNCINRVDELFGLTLRVMEEKGLAKDLVVVFVGDNGPPFADAKTTCNEAGVKVPCLVRWPGHHPAGSTSEALVSLADLMPTLLEAAGADVPRGLAGQSLTGVLRGDTTGWRSTLACEYTTHEPNDFNPLRSIRDGRYKLILGLIHDPAAGLPAQLDGTPLSQAFRRFGLNEAVELYDLENDPWEKTNLAESADPEARAARERLEQALLAWRKETADPLLDPAALVRLTQEQYERSKSYVPKPPPTAEQAAAQTQGKPAARPARRP